VVVGLFHIPAGSRTSKPLNPQAQNLVDTNLDLEVLHLGLHVLGQLLIAVALKSEARNLCLFLNQLAIQPLELYPKHLDDRLRLCCLLISKLLHLIGNLEFRPDAILLLLVWGKWFKF